MTAPPSVEPSTTYIDPQASAGLRMAIWVTQGQAADGSARHSKLEQIGSEEIHFSPRAEKFSISECRLGPWLPSCVEAIKPGN
jgi:hypothetical protein